MSLLSFLPFETSDHKWLLQHLENLIAIHSVRQKSQDGAPYGANTLHALNYMLDLAKTHDLMIRNIDGHIGYVQWGQTGPLIAVLCHLDVVPPGEGWTSDPYKLIIHNDRLIGRGVIDNKGPALSSLLALIRLKRYVKIPPCRFRLILGLNEESGSSCVEHYLESGEEKPAFGFTPDADFPVIYAEKGILHLRISSTHEPANLLAVSGDRPNMVPASCHIKQGQTDIFSKGLAAHASEPHLGKNAIDVAMKNLPDKVIQASTLLSLYKQHLIFHSSKPMPFNLPSDHTGKLTVNAGMLDIKDGHGHLILDIRYPVSENKDKIILQLSDLLTPYHLSLKTDLHQAPLSVPQDSLLITTFLSVYCDHLPTALDATLKNPHQKEEYFTKRPKPLAIGGGTYARSMPNIVAFGAAFPWDPSQAHQADESIHINAPKIWTQIIEDALLRLGKMAQ